MKRCSRCGEEYAGAVSKDGAAYRLVDEKCVTHVYVCWRCHNDSYRREYPRVRPGKAGLARKEVKS
jgi:DNA-directed RNA polymerase subunit RPC12/RpoP